jgi:hypothetical protein
MWIATAIGFYSIVQKPTGTICVRARTKADMDAFVKLIRGCGKPIHTPAGDYPWRVNLSLSRFAREFHKLALLVDYPNFKAKVMATNPERAMLYAPVWSHLMRIEDEELPKFKAIREGSIANELDSRIAFDERAEAQNGEYKHGEESNSENRSAVGRSGQR